MHAKRGNLVVAASVVLLVCSLGGGAPRAAALVYDEPTTSAAPESPGSTAESEAASAPQQPPAAPTPAPAAPAAPPTMADVLAAAGPDDWQPLDPEQTLYVDLPAGRVVIALARDFAPRHVANVQALAREGYFDGLPVVRSQDNYVVQWGDPAEEPAAARPMQTGQRNLAAEMDRAAAGLTFTPLADGDVYAPEVGHSGAFPVARDPAAGRVWLAHCYAMVGAGRGNTADSGSGAQLYVVIGHSPRHLDRNVTLLGRVVQGMELLSTLPRGSGPLGFYEDAAQRLPIRSIRVAADVPAAERTPLELLRTDTATWEALIDARRHRRESWFLDPVGRIEVCNVPLPVRPQKPPAPPAP
jgi:peptidylprolyl isomerase